MSASIVVEDGSIVTGANSYVSAADLSTYASNRGISITGISADLLIQAMDYIDNLPFIGVKFNSTQPLQWPRVYAIIDGYYIDANVIPLLLKEAVCEVALAIDAGNSPLLNVAPQTRRETVGDISIEYAPNAAPNTIVPKINNKLRKLLDGSSGGNSFKVNKA